MKKKEKVIFSHSIAGATQSRPTATPTLFVDYVPHVATATAAVFVGCC